MTSREKVKRIFTHRSNGAGAMWTGHPNPATVPLLAEAWGIAPQEEAIFAYLRDDCRSFGADGAYRHPEGRPAFDPGLGIERASLSAEGCLARAQSAADVDRYPWPDPAYLDFADVYARIDAFPDRMVFTGMSCMFFHLMADFFGMENYFIQMHENPAVIEAATERIVDYYVRANDRFLSGLGNRADAILLVNDFGTQLDLFISPAHFRRFVLPYFRRAVEVGKRHGKIVILHSCGSIARVIPDLIDIGVDVLHPIQAQARGMDALSLRQYKHDVAFLGGIDAQSFFVNATPAQIADEVRRVRDVLGPSIVISPSHEEILPNIPPENLYAMAQAALE